MPQPSVQPAPAESSLAEAIEAELRRRIIAGALAPGAALRQEWIAAEFGASAIPVREALRRLERTGLVAFRPRRGAVVAEVSAAEAREVAEMRAALEPLALRRAIAAQTPADLAAAAEAIARADASQAVLDWLEANRAFHWALIRRCGRPRLLATIADLWSSGDRHLVMVWQRLDYQALSQDEHRAILARCADGDGVGAAALLRRHITAAGEALVRLLEDEPGAG